MGDTLFVSYMGIPRLDMYTLDLKRVGHIDLTRPEPVMPSAFAVNDSQIVVCDHGKGALVIFDRLGNYIDSFGLLPDQKTRLMPLALAMYQNIAYVADMALKRILAVSLAENPNVASRGELILQIPGSEAGAFGFPSAVFITPDGRMLVGDAGESKIRVFTCDGREVYQFSPVPGQAGIAPQGFALDDRRDPSLQGTDSFDPSGARELGRIHVVDGNKGVVHMFNPLGEFLASYPSDKRLDGPSDITIARRAHRIFIADSRAKRIHIFSYGGK
jgi:hypothetical protein